MRRKTPHEKKQLSLQKDRRNSYGEMLNDVECVRAALRTISRQSNHPAEIGENNGELFVRLTDPHSDRWGVVSTPGYDTVSLYTDLGYGRFHLDEDLPTEDLIQIIEGFAKVADAYVESGGVVTPGRFPFSWPRMTVQASGGEVVLTRTLARDMKEAVAKTLAEILNPPSRTSASGKSPRRGPLANLRLGRRRRPGSGTAE